VNRLGRVQQVEILPVDGHVVAEGNRRRLNAAHQMLPAPGFVGGVNSSMIDW
jgi:hypothetical protein